MLPGHDSYMNRQYPTMPHQPGVQMMGSRPVANPQMLHEHGAHNQIPGGKYQRSVYLLIDVFANSHIHGDSMITITGALGSRLVDPQSMPLSR